MYFVNRSDINERLDYIDTLFQYIEEQKTFGSSLEKLALERITHVMIEAIIDVGNMMIDGFIMRDPGSYHDIIDILIDENVLPKDHEKSYKALIDLRRMLVQTYLQVDHAEIEKVLNSHKEVLKQFSLHIRTYLDNELGVAHAFSNE